MPGSEGLPHLPEATSFHKLTKQWPGYHPLQEKNSVLLPLTWKEVWKEAHAGLGYSLCCYTTRIPPPPPELGRVHVPAEISLVCDWMALAFHFGSHEINWSSLFKLGALRHENENVTVAVLQENACLDLNESTEALNIERPTCLMNEGTVYMWVIFFPSSELPRFSSQSPSFLIMMWIIFLPLMSYLN